MYVNGCANFQWSIKCNRVWETTSQFTFVYDSPAWRRAIVFQETNRRAVFIWFRLMLPRVNSEYNRVTRKQLFLVYKIERSHPLARSGYNIIERERRKTIEEDPAITAFPRRGPEPQEDETFLSFYLVNTVSLYRPCSMHRALRLFVSVKKRASLAPGPVFSGRGGSNLKGNLCVRKNDRDYR